MTVYVVTTGSYSDYSIHSIHSTQERAQFFAAHLRDANDVEEWTIDDVNPDNYWPQGKRAWVVLFAPDGAVQLVRESDWQVEAASAGEVFRSPGGAMTIAVWAHNEPGARKAAEDRRIAWLAEQAMLA